MTLSHYLEPGTPNWICPRHKVYRQAGKYLFSPPLSRLYLSQRRSAFLLDQRAFCSSCAGRNSGADRSHGARTFTATRKGPKLIAAKWATNRKIPQIAFKPDWTRRAKAAPFKRNDGMPDNTALSFIEPAFADPGYAGERSARATRMTVEMVKWPGQVGLAVQLRRWVVRSQPDYPVAAPLGIDADARVAQQLTAGRVNCRSNPVPATILTCSHKSFMSAAPLAGPAPPASAMMAASSPRTWRR